MSQTIDAATSVADITRALALAGVEYSETDGIVCVALGDQRRLHIYQHEQQDGADIAGLWAWNEIDGDGEHTSGGLDSFEELLRLVVDRDSLVSWLESGAGEVYDEVGESGLVELSDASAALCEAYGLTVDVDSYGCAYCVEHTIR